MGERSLYEKLVRTVLEWGGELLLSVVGLAALLLVGWLISRALLRTSKDPSDGDSPPKNLGE